MNIDYMISRDNTRLYEELLPDKNECAFLHMNLLLIMLIELCYMNDVEYDIEVIFQYVDTVMILIRTVSMNVYVMTVCMPGFHH